MKKLKECIDEKELIKEFTDRVFNEIYNLYDLSEDKAKEKMKNVNFFKMIEECPDMVMYQSPKDWAKEVVEDEFFLYPQ